jgi:hypothetical protein
MGCLLLLQPAGCAQHWQQWLTEQLLFMNMGMPHSRLAVQPAAPPAFRPSVVCMVHHLRHTIILQHQVRWLVVFMVGTCVITQRMLC